MNSSTSQTKQQLIDRHQSNQLLQAPFLAPNQQTPHDLSVDQPTRSPDRQMVDTATTALERVMMLHPTLAGIRESWAQLRGTGDSALH